MMSCSVPSFRLANVCEIHISTINSIGFDNSHCIWKLVVYRGTLFYPLHHRADVEAKVWFLSRSRRCYVSATTESVHATNPNSLKLHSWQKKVVTPPLKTIKPMWIEFLRFHLAEIGMIWTRDCSPTKSDTTLGRHSMQGQVGSSRSETTV